MPGPLKITVAETAQERREFIEFQWQVYRDDPDWVPPLLSEREEFLDPQRHPFHQHARVRYFIARRDGKPVGTIAGILNDNHNQHWNEQVGFFGLFEVLDDREAAEALLQAAEDFVRSAGMTTIRGPFNFSTNEECGLLVDGWNGPPVIMMTYNPRYYQPFIEGAGYTKAMDLLAYTTDLTRYKPDGTGINPKLLRVAQKTKERHSITVRPIDWAHFDEEIQRVKQVYNAAWSKNWGFVPLTEAEMEHLARGLKSIVDPKTIFFAEKEGKPIAFMVPFPNISQALIRAYPKPGTPEWITMIKLLYWWKVRGVVTEIRAAIGGVIEEYRGQGVDAVVFLETLLAGVRQGYKRLEISWVLESNTPMRQTAAIFDGEVYRTYRIYEKSLVRQP